MSDSIKTLSWHSQHCQNKSPAYSQTERHICQCRYLQIAKYQLWWNNSWPLIKTLNFFFFTPIRCQKLFYVYRYVKCYNFKYIFDRYGFLIADICILGGQKRHSGIGILNTVKIKAPLPTHQPNRKTNHPMPIFKKIPNTSQYIGFDEIMVNH